MISPLYYPCPAIIIPHPVKYVNAQHIKNRRNIFIPAVFSIHTASALSHRVVLVERVAALRAELRGMLGIGGYPAALVALIFLGCSGLGLAAVGAELRCVRCTALALPLGG